MNNLHQSDQRILAYLAENLGPEPTLDVSHIFYFPNKQLAEQANTALLATHDAEVYQEPVELAGMDWQTTILMRDQLVSAERVAKWRAELEAHATRFGGTYQRWGVASQDPAVQRFSTPTGPYTDLLTTLRGAIEEVGIAGDPTKLADFFDYAFEQWAADDNRDPRPFAIDLVAVGLGDWICAHTNFAWHEFREGNTEAEADEMQPELVLHDPATKATAFIVDSVRKRWGSGERLDDFVYQVVESINAGR
ncbi:ribonuclease E inhibitor RraB [Staphylococcus chromogenes]|nr:ribonuclease E inhibitor RraB [Staphylococcus chromogenes]